MNVLYSEYYSISIDKTSKAILSFRILPGHIVHNIQQFSVYLNSVIIHYIQYIMYIKNGLADLFRASLIPFHSLCHPSKEKKPGHPVMGQPVLFQESSSLSSASSEPDALLNRLSSCSTVSFFFSSPDTSTATWPLYIIISRLP